MNLASSGGGLVSLLRGDRRSLRLVTDHVSYIPTSEGALVRQYKFLLTVPHWVPTVSVAQIFNDGQHS